MIRSSMPPRAVSTITAELVWERARRSTSRPSTLGSMRSRTIRSGDGGQRPDRGLAVADRGDAEALALEVTGDDLADHLLVVDDEDVRGSRHGQVEVAPASLRARYGWPSGLRPSRP